MQREFVKGRSAITPANTWTVKTIPVWFHVIRSGLTLAQGNIPASWIVGQLNVLNAAFAGSFTFVRAGTTNTTNSNWFNLNPDTATEAAMKSSLRRGNYSTLNIYILGADFAVQLSFSVCLFSQCLPRVICHRPLPSSLVQHEATSLFTQSRPVCP
jgi:hypothetical protein